MRPYAGRFSLGLLATFGASVLDGVTIVLLVPLLKQLFGGEAAKVLTSGSAWLGRAVDNLLAPLIGGLPPSQAAGRIVLVLLAGLMVKNALSYTSNQISVAVQEGVVRDLRTRLFRHLLGIDLGLFQRTKSGQLISGIIVDADSAKAVVSAALASLFQNLVLILVSVVILMGMSARLTILTVATAPLLVLGMRVLLARLRRHSKVWADQRGELTATVAERISAIKLIRSYGTETLESQRFEEQATRYRKGIIRIQRFSSLTSPVSEVFGGCLIILIIWAATTPWITGGTLGPAETITFLVAALKMMSPIKSISQFPASMATAMASADRVFDLLDIPLTEADHPGEGTATFNRDLVFDRVSFRYPNGAPVLQDVSFSVSKGKVVALVGPSGAGKTTLLELLPRFHDVVAGEIRLDGIPLGKLTRRSIRSLLGIVSQDTVILNDTVSANIAYGRPRATRAEVEAAAAAANARDFIAELPLGYDTVLGERGTRLSGGQRQRIAIARALLRDPPILILDEATSALDTESERLVQQAIDRLMKDRTVLVIAHRLATVRHADEIITLDAGRVVERGTHAALLDRDGLYRRLHDLQFREVAASA